MEYNTTQSSAYCSLPLTNEQMSDNFEHQYVLPLGQSLQEDQQLAIEVNGQDGVKYLYILSDNVPVQNIKVVQSETSENVLVQNTQVVHNETSENVLPVVQNIKVVQNETSENVLVQNTQVVPNETSENVLDQNTSADKDVENEISKKGEDSNFQLNLRNSMKEDNLRDTIFEDETENLNLEKIMVDSQTGNNNKLKSIEYKDGENNETLKSIEDRSCGTMTEYTLLEPERNVKTPTIIVSPMTSGVNCRSSAVLKDHRKSKKFNSNACISTGVKGHGKNYNDIFVKEKMLATGIKFREQVICKASVNVRINGKSQQILNPKCTSEGRSLLKITGEGQPSDKSITNNTSFEGKSLVSLIKDSNLETHVNVIEGMEHEPEMTPDSKEVKYIGGKSVNIFGKDFTVMNEMKISTNNQCISNSEKFGDNTCDIKEGTEYEMEICEGSINQKGDNKKDNSVDKRKDNSVDKSTNNKGGEDHLKLDQVNDETCEEILASLQVLEKQKENKVNILELKDTKPKFQYERPTTRTMSKSKREKDEIVCNGKNGKITYKCRICRKVYTQLHTLKQHIKIHENQSFPCEICDKTFNTEKKLSKHIETHSTEQPHLCYVCGEAFRKKETLENHMYTHSGEKPYKCDVCGAAFIKKYYLIRHQTCHTGVKPFSCSDCDKKFRTRGDLQRHERVHGEKPGVKQFKCDKCDKRYCCESGLLRHERAHKGEKPYSCEVCSKTFSMQGDLKRHYKTHFGGVYFDCKLCGKRLTSDVGFKRHQRMHSGEKPYKCSICSSRFVDQWGLMQHKKLHDRKQQIKMIKVEPMEVSEELNAD